MKKYCVYSITMPASSDNAESKIIAEFDNKDDAQIFLAKIFEKNRFSADIRDVFFDGNTLNMFNTSGNCYSNYRIKEKE